MKISIMQPYFWPYLGYFQLMHSSDAFVIYDNIQYIKGGWINRNRILVNGRDAYITLPLEKNSNYLDISKRSLVVSFKQEADSILRRLEGAYVKAPFVNEGLEFAETCLRFDGHNLFDMLYHSVVKTMEGLGLERRIIVSSGISSDRSENGQIRVLSICKALGATQYINPPGGRSLYSKEKFTKEGVDLLFLEPQIEKYQQINATSFIANLSIIDMLMSVGWAGMRLRINNYKIEKALQ